MDAINRRGIGEQYQPWDRTRRRDRRHAGSPPGGLSSWQYPFPYRYDCFHYNNVPAVFGIDALPRVAANAGKIYPASAGSLRYFFINSRYVHSVSVGSASRRGRPDYSWNRLGAGDCRRAYEGDPRSFAASDASAVSLSGDGLAGSHFCPAAFVGGSAFCVALASRRWNRLYDRRLVLCEGRRALFSFCLALVRPYGNGLSFCSRANLRALTHNFCYSRAELRVWVGQVC